MLGRDGGDDIASTVPKQNVLFTAFTLTSNVSPHRDVMLDQARLLFLRHRFRIDIVSY
jgi:hypothetical protein